MSAVARGPLQFLLQSSTGQYAFIGMGFFAMFPEKIDSLLPMVQKALTEIPASFSLPQSVPNAPIVIQTTGGGNQVRSITSTLTSYFVGAGACWVCFLVATNALPEGMKEMLPVTRKFFESTTKALGVAVVNVKEVLEKQIIGLTKKQDELSKKQDETHKDVLEMTNDLSEARADISSIGNSLGRCESSLAASKHMQSYTLRGVKLLVRCVNTIVPNSDEFTGELSEFIKSGESLNVGMKPVTPIEPRKSSLLQLEKSFPTEYKRSASLPVSPTGSKEDTLKYLNELLGR